MSLSIPKMLFKKHQFGSASAACETPSLVTTGRLFLRSFFVLVVLSVSLPAVADTIYVSTRGDDDNPGTRSLPLRTVSAGCLSLSPGDQLVIMSGEYRDEGNIFVRFVRPDDFRFVPLEGTPEKTTLITSIGKTPPKIFGSFDIRGSHIRIRRLNVIGDGVSPNPGFAIFESHHIDIRSCEVSNHGGGGIQFNHSDVVAAVDNVCMFNAATNPDQHSGISSFQPVVRTDDDESTGVLFARNVCIGNQNFVPNPFSGNITDGNGIIIDDHRYVQFNGLLADIIAEETDPEFSSGEPRIDLDAAGNLLSYGRRSVVFGNECVGNGGRGIHLFQADNALVHNNVCLGNLLSEELTLGLPRDENGEPFFRFGELSVVDSFRIRVIRNQLFANSSDSVAAAELFFELSGQQSTNLFLGNLLFNLSAPELRTSVLGVERSSLK